MSQFEIQTRQQYTFNATDKTLTLLLTELVRHGTIHINIVGQLITKIKNKSCNLVKIIVGIDDPTNIARGGAGSPPNPNFDNAAQNARFVEILKRFNIKFSQQRVIQINNIQTVVGTPGAFRILYTRLNCAKINIISNYVGEPTLVFPLVQCSCNDGSSFFRSNISTFFFEVPDKDVDRGVNVLKTTNLSQPFNEAQLCINRDNIALKTKNFKAKKCDPCDSHSDSDSDSECDCD